MLMLIHHFKYATETQCEEISTNFRDLGLFSSERRREQGSTAPRYLRLPELQKTWYGLEAHPSQ